MRTEIQQKIDDPPDFQVDLRNKNISDDELLEIINYIHEKKPDVQEIYLGNNCLEIVTKKAVDILNKFKNIRTLELQSNTIDKQSIENILMLRQAHPSLNLYLNGNAFTDEGQMDNLKNDTMISRKLN